MKRYEESIFLSALDKKSKSCLSNKDLLSKKRSLSSLSNSSMLTPKHTTTLDSTKIVEMKQSYPILMEEVKQLRKDSEGQQKSREMFVEEMRDMLMKQKENTRITKEELAMAIEHKLTEYLYP